MIRVSSHLKSRVLATTSVAAIGLALASMGGGAAQAADEAAEAERIIVTGSRIVRRDFEASSPILTIEADSFENQSTIGLETGLNRLPQFNPDQTQFGLNTGDVEISPTNNPGSASLNLRGLGSNRNLVLIDGRRPMPSNASSVVDINTIPASAIESVEIISGGASAVYGADAIAGVVNFKLRRDFEGFELDGQWGTTEAGDGDEVSIGALIGASFDDARGNAMLGINWSQRAAAFQRNRDFFTEGWLDPGTPGGFSDLVAYTFPSMTALSFPLNQFGLPSQAAVDCLFAGNAAAEGVHGAGACAGNPNAAGKGLVPGDIVIAFPFQTPPFSVNFDGTVFSPRPSLSGVPAPGYTGVDAAVSGDISDPFKVLNSNLNPVGGRVDETGANNPQALTSLPLDRFSMFGSAHYQLTDSVTAFIQASYANTKTETILFQAPSVQFWGTDVPYGSGIDPATIDGMGNTLPQFAAVCGPVGGCTNSESHPVPAELAYLLDSRGPGGGPFVGANGPWNLSQNTLTGPRTTENTTDTFQILAGFEGTLPIRDWTWEVYGSHGETSFVTDYPDGWVSQQKLQAVVAAPFYGENLILRPDSANPTPGFGGTCTSGLQDAIFNGGTMSADCEELISIRMSSITDLSQDVFEANVQGGVLDLPAGELRFAAGVGYRGNDFKFIPDTNLDEQSVLQQPIGVFGSNQSIGATDVTEGYGELLVPVLADVPLVQSLDLELGYRYSDYDTAGGVDTYKALANWELNDWLSFRGGVQQATRAANIAELYQGKAQDVVGFTGDPCTTNSVLPWGVNEVTNTNDTHRNNARTLCNYLLTVRVQPGALAPAFPSYDPDLSGPFFFGNGPVTIDVAQGNVDVQPETADTVTIGGVFTSPIDNALLRGIRVSLDWYQIEITDAIATATTDINYAQCFNEDGSSNPAFSTAGATGPDLFAGNPFCENILREASTGIARISSAPYTNLGGINTSGFDLQVDWVAELEDLGFGLPGTTSINLVMNFLDEFEVQATPGASFADYTGTTGNATTGGSQFDYRAFTTFGYSVGPMALGLRWRYLPEIDNSAIVNNPATTILATDAHSEFDLFGRWALNETVELRGGIDNLLNEDPEIVGANPPGGAGNITNARGITNGNYDTLGRRFFLGAKVRY